MARTERNGVGAWAREGIVGRGVLVDWHAWRVRHGRAYDAFETGTIPLAELQAALREQGTEVRFGDVLLIRSGYLEAYRGLSREEVEAVRGRQPLRFTGVEQSEEMLEWLWGNFSAAGGDQPSFEAWPTQREWALHEVMLAGWGMPIGELFDLEALAAECARLGRWSFFFTSKVCNVPGGVASPPNALAIF